MLTCPSCGQETPEGFPRCAHCGAALDPASAGREQRKTVTALFCDVTGSTALGESSDPEALRSVLARYFERMKGIVESHGGTVEKFIGDAVMAVFGVPQVHEDDALRACRAAVEMRDALPALGVQARIGVNTGEVVTGTEERLATGDAVNVAARLEQAAQPGEILIGEPTLALVREAVSAEPVEPLELKGKAKPVQAFRLVALQEAPERGHESPFVGREREIEVVREAWARAESEEGCELVTIIGDAGVGKSRLVAEALVPIGAPVVRGRCLPYGEGITYWPVVEVVKQLDTLPSDPAAAAAVRSLLGESEQAASADDIAWGVRKLLEECSPLVVVLDDIHWAEETFLDLVEHIGLLAGAGPLLLVCMARPDLQEGRPQWPVSLRLEPLEERSVDELIPESFGGELREKIAHASGGNPLFVQEMVAMASETEGEVVVPPNLHALLAARLDQLEEEERSVLERGAVEGELFHRGSVQALSGNGQVTPRLAALVRKELVRPDKAQLPDDDAFRFRHLLIRDAAYEALPKAERAELHERFARWLEEHGADLIELDEILGYHLEQAVRYRREVGTPGDGDLQEAARARLSAAAGRAMTRFDMAAALNLLERALALVPEGQVDLGLEVDLIDALFHAGRMDDAAERATSLVARARSAGDEPAELCGELWSAMIPVYIEPEGATERLEEVTARAMPVLEAAGDERALLVGDVARCFVAHMRAQMDTERDALEHALARARRLRLPHLESRLLTGAGATRVHGTTPVSVALAWFDEQGQKAPRHPSLRADRTTLVAMLGRFDEARAVQDELRVELADRGAKVGLALTTGHLGVELELLAGDSQAAIELGEEGCAMLEEIGERSWLSTAAGKLAQAYYVAGRLDDARSAAERAKELGASDDALTQMLWRQVSAKVLARRGELEEAERLAREAVATGDETQMMSSQADAYLDLAEVLELAGKDPRPALEEALGRYERKGNLVMAERTRERLGSLLQLDQ